MDQTECKNYIKSLQADDPGYTLWALDSLNQDTKQKLACGEGPSEIGNVLMYLFDSLKHTRYFYK